MDITGGRIMEIDGTVKHSVTEDTTAGNDNEFQLPFYEGDGSTGTLGQSFSFDTGDTITVTYVLTIEDAEQEPVTIAITAGTACGEGNAFPVTGRRACKICNSLYVNTLGSDARLIAASVRDIDISGMSMTPAAILRDSLEVTGAGQVQTADGLSASRRGIDFALSIEAVNEPAANRGSDIGKTYENASMTAGDFVFNLYSADGNDIWCPAAGESPERSDQPDGRHRPGRELP